MLICISSFIIGSLVAYIVRLKKRLKEMTKNRNYYLDCYDKAIIQCEYFANELDRYTNRKRDAHGRFTK